MIKDCRKMIKDSRKLTTAFALSIIMTLVSLPFGILPLIYSIRAYSNSNDEDVRHEYIEKAYRCAKISALIFLSIFIISAALLLIFYYAE